MRAGTLAFSVVLIIITILFVVLSVIQAKPKIPKDFSGVVVVTEWSTTDVKTPAIVYNVTYSWTDEVLRFSNTTTTIAHMYAQGVTYTVVNNTCNTLSLTEDQPLFWIPTDSSWRGAQLLTRYSSEKEEIVSMEEAERWIYTIDAKIVTEYYITYVENYVTEQREPQLQQILIRYRDPDVENRILQYDFYNVVSSIVAENVQKPPQCVM